MSVLLLCYQLIAGLGGLSLDSLSITGAPFNLTNQWQEVELREALTANTGSPRLIIYLRDLESVGLDRDRVVEQLPQVFPLDSIEAEVFTRDERGYALRLRDYSFFRGMPGLVLQAVDVPRGASFYRVRVRAKTPIRNAVMVWLDSLGRSRPD